MIFFHFLGISMYVLNTEVFGFILKTFEYESFEQAIRETINWKLKSIGLYGSKHYCLFTFSPSESSSCTYKPVYLFATTCGW